MILQKKVDVRFEIELRQGDSFTEVPCLVGSVKELGSWNASKGIFAKKAEGDFIWKVDVKISPNTHLFFSWNFTMDGENFQNDGMRSLIIENNGGIVKTRYQDPEVQFEPNNNCRIHLRTNYKLGYNEMLGLIGAGDLLGNWRAEDALVPLNCKTHWEVQLDVPRGTSLEFKWVIIDIEFKMNKPIKRWQDGANREIKIDDDLKYYIGLVPWDGLMIKLNDVQDCQDIADEEITSTSQATTDIMTATGPNISNTPAPGIVAVVGTITSDTPTPGVVAATGTTISDTPTPGTVANIGTRPTGIAISSVSVNNNKWPRKDTSSLQQGTIGGSENGNDSQGTHSNSNNVNSRPNYGYKRQLFKDVFDVAYNIYRQWTFNQ